MKPIDAFHFHIDQLHQLLIKAAAETDPGMWLLKNNARTSVFMVEALCKLYKELDEPIFTKLKERFKTLEDGIGQLDYYVAFEEQFKEDANIAAFLKKKINSISKKLNAVLTDEKWIIKDFKRIRKAKEKLAKIKWPEEKENVLLIDRFYKKSIDEIDDFYNRLKGNFTDVENQVHELRRKLRWLSIYPHAVRGVIQLHGNAENEDLRQYNTEDVIKSPFNTFPAHEESLFVFLLNKAPFYALSWMISSLGKLKDDGLKYELLKEAGIKNPEHDQTLKQILDKSSADAATFFDKKVLQQLVYTM